MGSALETKSSPSYLEEFPTYSITNFEIYAPAFSILFFLTLIKIREREYKI